MRFSTRAEAALRRNGGRITRARRALIRAIESSPRPLRPREIQALLASEGVRMDRVSVYRNLGALLDLGLLHRVVGSRAVRPCSEKERRCHHAIVCTECGSAREFHSGPLERALGDVRRATRYQVQGHVIELRGICERCRR
jgi:Fur family zinc uptake transcriptional regulator